MNKGFDIEHVRDGQYATLYTYRVAGEERTAFGNFLISQEVTSAPDLARLLDRLIRMTDQLGIYDKRINSWLRDEGDRTSALWAPIPDKVLDRDPKPPPTLRLYCYRFDEHEYSYDAGKVSQYAPILLIGNGGVKRTLRPCDERESRVCSAFTQIKQIRKAINKRFEEGDLEIVDDGFSLSGDLAFEAPY